MSRTSKARRRDRREAARWESDLFTGTLPVRQGKPIEDPAEAARLAALTRGLPTGIPRDKPIDQYTPEELALLESFIEPLRPKDTMFIVGTEGYDSPSGPEMPVIEPPILEIPGEVIDE